MSKYFGYFAAVCMVALLGRVEVVAANIAGNPGFEVAGVGGSTDSAFWEAYSPGGPGALSERDDSNPFVGSYDQKLVAVGGDGFGSDAGITQNSIANVGLLSLEPGTTLDASFKFSGSYGDGGVGNAWLKILNGVGAIVADTGPVALPSNGVYGLVSTPVLNVPAFGAAPNDVYAAFLQIQVSAGAFVGSTATGYVDSVSINGTTIVPEPAMFTLVGLAGLGLVGFWGRRR
jgi:hypothetical protein